MRAAVLHGARDVRIEEVPDAPAPGPGEVLLRPRHNGVCGSDLHFWQEGPRHGIKPPIVLGHEFSAEVAEVGPGVADGIIPGALVAVEPVWTCGTCAPCRNGAYNLCETIHWHGLSGRGGGLSGLTLVRAGMVHVLPPGIDAAQAALIEPISVAHHGVSRARIGPGEAALVLGAGPIGVATALDLHARGVEQVVVSEPSPVRRAAAATALRAVGARTLVLDPREVDVPDAVREATSGTGAHAVIDAAGTEAAFHTGLAAAARGGRMVVVAAYTRPVAFDPTTAFFKEMDILSSCAYRGDFPEVIRLMAAGAYPMDGWVRGIPMGDVPAAFSALEAGTEMKLLVDVAG